MFFLPVGELLPTMVQNTSRSPNDPQREKFRTTLQSNTGQADSERCFTCFRTYVIRVSNGTRVA
jgi:hypothetical protein